MAEVVAAAAVAAGNINRLINVIRYEDINLYSGIIFSFLHGREKLKNHEIYSLLHY